MTDEGPLAPREPRKPFTIITADPEFDPKAPVMVNGYLFEPFDWRCPEPIEDDDDIGGGIDG